MSPTLRSFAFVVIIFLCALTGACESMGKGGQDDQLSKQERRQRNRERRERERDRLGDRDRDPDQVISRDPDRRSGDSGRLSRGLDEMPTTASRVDEGDGPRLTYSPTRDGTLYVYDVDGDRVVFSTRVRQDERFALDPDAGRATLDGRTVLGTGLSPRNRYRLYFDRGTRP